MRTPDMRTSNLRRSLLVLVATLALIATSCGGSSADTAVVADAAATQTAEEPAEASLVATTVAGEQIDFGSLEGQDVVLWFWAPW